jgi:hypothetical protein
MFDFDYHKLGHLHEKDAVATWNEETITEFTLTGFLVFF